MGGRHAATRILRRGVRCASQKKRKKTDEFKFLILGSDMSTAARPPAAPLCSRKQSMSPSLDSLPEPSLVFSRLDLATATSLAAVSKSWRAGCHEPLCEPRWQFFLQSRWGVEATDRPREALAWLETAVRKEMACSYRRGFETMFSGGAFSLSVHVDHALLAESELFESELFWEAPARKLLLWLPLHERRRLASFVCHDSHPRASLDRVLRAFPQAGSPSPLAALRGLLLQFPFLPIDAGSGADRVIGLFSMHWLRDNPSAWASVGLDGGLPLPEARHTVYSLVYATIVLNTDLHNPAVKTKMSRAQFLTNCREAPYLQFVPERLLLET